MQVWTRLNTADTMISVLRNAVPRQCPTQIEPGTVRLIVFRVRPRRCCFGSSSRHELCATNSEHVPRRASGRRQRRATARPGGVAVLAAVVLLVRHVEFRDADRERAACRRAGSDPEGAAIVGTPDDDGPRDESKADGPATRDGADSLQELGGR
jgi:hypothetical protein